MVMMHLGTGGFGDVYQCGEKAVKIIKCLRNGIWCYNEVCLSQHLIHPNILSTDYAYIKDGQVHLVMDIADTDLNKWRRENIASESQILDWMSQILSALTFMHSRDILHCDIKPSNLLKFGDNIKIADFSLSRKIGYRNGGHVCTHGHRPPEYWRKDPPKPGHWVDIWALGCTLYYLIRGKPIFPPYRSSAHRVDRNMYYQRIYRNYSRDYQTLTLSSNLLQRLIILMLNPDYKTRPTAESLLTMVAIARGTKPMKVEISDLIVSVLSPDIQDQLVKLAESLNLKLESEIIRLSNQIAKVVEHLVKLNPELYLLTTIWIASKIVSDRAYDHEVLGLSLSSMLEAEQTICSVSRFKFCII